MKTIVRRTACAAALLTLTTAVATAQEMDVDGDILLDDQGLFSFYQAPGQGSDPFFFEDGADFGFTYDFASGTVGLGGAQLFLLESEAGDSALLAIFDLSIDTNDTDGFLSGSLTASFDSGPQFTVLFPNSNTDGTPFNTTTIENGQFSAFLSGAAFDGPQINLAFTGRVGPVGVAEPGALALLAMGGFAFGFSRRR